MLIVAVLGRFDYGGPGTSTYPGDEAMADVLGIAGVLLELLQERVAVEVQDLFHVTEEHVRFVSDTCRRDAIIVVVRTQFG